MHEILTFFPDYGSFREVSIAFNSDLTLVVQFN